MTRRFHQPRLRRRNEIGEFFQFGSSLDNQIPFILKARITACHLDGRTGTGWAWRLDPQAENFFHDRRVLYETQLQTASVGEILRHQYTSNLVHRSLCCHCASESAVVINPTEATNHRDTESQRSKAATKTASGE